ncbi:hypothetical protein GW17_00042375 [Ensete ventricosum]|nr:hypothetical protein GW17_00042375 [Ensete ventricosum]
MIKRYRQNRPSTIDFDRRRPIEGEIDRRQSISTVGDRLREKRKRRKKKKKRRRRKKYLLFPCRPRPRTVAALIHGRFFSRARRRNVSPRG